MLKRWSPNSKRNKKCKKKYFRLLVLSCLFQVKLLHVVKDLVLVWKGSDMLWAVVSKVVVSSSCAWGKLTKNTVTVRKKRQAPDSAGEWTQNVHDLMLCSCCRLDSTAFHLREASIFCQSCGWYSVEVWA